MLTPGAALLADAERLSTHPGFRLDFTLSFAEALPLRLLELWEAKRQGSALPRRADFDMATLRPHLGWLCIADVAAEIDDLRYRLIGSRITEMVGRDMTGRLVSETLPEAAVAIFRYLIRHPYPARTCGRLEWRDRGFMEHETLLLPLAADGQTVDQFLVEMVFPGAMPVHRG